MRQAPAQPPSPSFPRLRGAGSRLPFAIPAPPVVTRARGGNPEKQQTLFAFAKRIVQLKR